MSQRLCGGAVLSALVLALALALPTCALAAGKAPVANGVLELQAWPENGSLVVVVALTVPPTVALPVTVRIPVPAEAQVQWTGEVLGGDPNLDPSRVHKIKTSPVGGRYAEFTLETTRAAQMDSVLPVLKTSGPDVSAAFSWVQSVSSPSMTFSVRVPTGATNVRITPRPRAAPDVGSGGQTLYSGDPIPLTPGSKTAVSVAYTLGAAAGAAPASANRGSSLIYFVVSALAVVVGILVVVLTRQRDASVSGVDHDMDDDMGGSMLSPEEAEHDVSDGADAG